MRSVSMRPSATHETGHSYFAQTGHSHFAATLAAPPLDKSVVCRMLRLAKNVRLKPMHGPHPYEEDLEDAKICVDHLYSIIFGHRRAQCLCGYGNRWLH